MTLARGTGVAIWRQIETALEEDIRAGRTGPDGRLQTETELAGRFGVNRHTVRRAIGVLARRGLLRIEQGRGTFAQRAPIDYPIARRTRFSENLANAGLAPSQRLLASQLVPADETLARELGLRKGSRLVHLRLLGLGEDRPLSVVDHWLAAARFGTLPALVAEEGSISAALSRCGVADYHRARTRVTATLADEETARLLRQSVERPVLRVESLNLDGAGQRFLFSIATFAGDAVQLQFEPGAE